MRILVIEHQRNCPPAWLGEWLEDAGATIEVVRPYAGDALPAALDDYAALLVLGGSAGAHDDDVPWIVPTKQLIATASVPVLGVCLGHQLVAAALGGRVGRNPAGKTFGLRRVGWLDGDDPLLGTRPQIGAFANDDIVLDLPDGAEVLARGANGEPQAVRYAETIWGLQLHPEVGARVMRDWALEDKPGDDPQPSPAEAEALAEVEAAESELRAAWQPVAARFAELVRAGGPTPASEPVD